MVSSLNKDLPTVFELRLLNHSFTSAEIPSGRINLNTTLCATCQTCISTCPHDIWKFDENKRETYIDEINAKNCSLDMECVEKCPTGSIEIISTDI